jgi:hypothetical protein
MAGNVFRTERLGFVSGLMELDGILIKEVPLRLT